MGVPKFFRYISERYPCLSEVVKEYQIPEFDNLYLDMNGIIHNCSHPDDNNPHFRITEEQIFKDIFHYLEVLFRMIRPRKLFFLAVDGVAPRAKMNQQRGRRFRSAKEAETLVEKAKAKGEILPTEARFDSNCITPGTLFMAKLHEQLKYFIVNKISTDKSWQNCKIILSGHETPGEGEHKIMDYIRYLRSQPGYDPHTRHCLYGLDADLIMLGLCTHEPYFSLLREEVKFSKKAKKTSVPEQITFYLLHLSLMREYLELEFISLKDKLNFEYSIENIIDDWVLMGFLVGNDFIPHLPNLHIHNNALPILYKTYMQVLPTFEGYINEGGKLNLERFGKFLNELSSIDTDAFEENYADLKYFEDKTGRRLENFEKPKTLEPFSFDNEEAEVTTSTSMKNDLIDLVSATDVMFSESENDASEGETDDEFFQREFKQHKNDYYMNKLEYANVTPEVLRSQAEGYVRAIQWNLHYYYNGCCSWSWYYPHHYAPYVSDIKEFSNLDLHYDLGRPFLPFEQLLAVLPSASKSLLPEVYQKLMTDENSPIYKYYPTDFQTDLNGKRQEWEAVVLIPFIEEKDLLDAMKSCDKELTSSERHRNSHGPMLLYEYVVESQGTYEAPEYFPRITNNHTTLKLFTYNDIRVPADKLIKGLYPGAKFDTYYPGFPTFKHLKYTPSLEKQGVRVFDQPSRSDNLLLNIENDEKPPPLEELAEKLLGQIVWVNWPHLTEAKVITVSNKNFRYELSNTQVSDEKYHVIDNTNDLLTMWKSSVRGVTERYINRLGINIGETDVVIHALLLTGRSYIFGINNKFTLEKQWSNMADSFPYQVTVQDIKVYDPNYVQYKNVNEVYPISSKCFMLGIPHYGSEGVIISHNDIKQTGRIKVAITAFPEPDFTKVRDMEKELEVQYMSSYKASQRLAISTNLFSRITGCVFVIPGERVSTVPENVCRTNIGLNLKFNKRNEEIPGYTKRDGNQWLYSLKAIQLVRDYMEFSPELFIYMADHPQSNVFFEAEIFPTQVGEDKIKEIAAWIIKQPYNSIERQITGSKLLDPEIVSQIEKATDEHFLSNKGRKAITMQVKPRLLYMPNINMGSLCPDSKATFYLYDRVVFVRECYTVPVGLKGTVIGIHEQQTTNSCTNDQPILLYDVVFDQEFNGGLTLNCSPNRGYRISAQSLINISYGVRLERIKTGGNNADQKQSNSWKGKDSNTASINSWRIKDTNQSAHMSTWKGKDSNSQSPNINSWRGKDSNSQPNSAFAVWNNNVDNIDRRSSHQVLQNYPAPTNVKQIESRLSGPPINLPRETGPPMNLPKETGSSILPKESGPPVNLSKTNVSRKKDQKQGLSEFQAIWNELHQLGKNMHGPKDEKPPQTIVSNPPNPVNNVPENKNNENKSILPVKSPAKSNENNSFKKIEDPNSSTELLKIMLKIKDDNKSKEEEPSPIKYTNFEKTDTSTPKKISIEELFKHATVSAEKNRISINQQQVPVKSYTIELLNRYQLLGLGIPRYTYILSGPENLIHAQIVLPNGKRLIGAVCPTREQASESVAQLALLDHSLMDVVTNYTNQPNSSLPSPPQQWFQRNVHMQQHNNSGRKGNQHNQNYFKKNEAKQKNTTESTNNSSNNTRKQNRQKKWRIAANFSNAVVNE
ncbi:5'-3' exoribonuclease 1 isoform X2 [Chrysoperla carnea]|uniref:5'-3' exoribonuclease 1 isoform X2 n=1 Tax=Chrysoperla carnea TaxID=189513 RepID=UPI001D060C24|nr:5'-3' exoribonuclease 1 isoform X2 [Chrysoperla carnea]